jgi:hypothetical protein
MSLVEHQTVTPQRFLGDYEPQRDWRLPAGVTGIDPVAALDGRGAYPLEVLLATSAREPTAGLVRELWTKRHENAPNPLLLIVAFHVDDRWHASFCGPAGDQPPVINRIDLSQAERLAEAALSEPSRHAAIRFLTAMLPEVGAELPGLRNQGMFASHELRDRVPARTDWQHLCAEAQPLLAHRGRELVERLGFRVEDHGTTTSVLAAGEQKRAVAVFLDEGEVFEEPTLRFDGASPVAYALAAADREGLPWAVLTRGRQIRVYSARPDVGVGRKGRAETFVEANLALLPDDQAGYLSLLFSAPALLPGGSFEQVLEESRDYAADLSTRLRDRVYKDTVPSLATALAARRGTASLDDVYERALNVLFRILFVAYAEDRDLLPYRSNGLYRERALKALARQLADRRQEGSLIFDPNDTSLWDDVVGLWQAIDVGNVELGVPAYNGGLFSSDPHVNPAGGALAQTRLSNAEFGPALTALVVDETAEGVVGPVDFRSLSVREFGTIYEGLLESNLSIAPTSLTLDAKANYVPAREGDEIAISEGAIYFHNRSGARKSSGSYFTKPFAVEHLLDHALDPALEDHVARINELLDAGEDAKAAQVFFDFRCVDLAMGSGHFLVAAVDRIEARLSALLAERPIAQIAAELERLRAAAYEALGALGEGIEIEHSSLLRRQVARRCIYGVDQNIVAVELARLGVWIHTFVPGLPLSFLDHALVEGDSLTGIGTIDEAVRALDPGDDTHMSIFRQPILDVLGRAQSALTRLARLSDASAAEIKDARQAQAEALEETQPVRDLFDLIVAARLGETDMPTAFDEQSIAAHPGLQRARELARALGCVHFPIVFPEVFLREQAGFNCTLGNPPWDKVRFEPQQFWVSRVPGFNALPAAERERRMEALRNERPDDAVLEQRVQGERETLQRLAEAAFELQGRGQHGHHDFAKLFLERALRLTHVGGSIGYVLPRQCLVLGGWKDLRKALLENADVRAAQAQNDRGWLFDDLEYRYMVVFISRRPATTTSLVSIAAGVSSPAELNATHPDLVVLTSDELASITDSYVIPWLNLASDRPAFETMRRLPRLGSGGWIKAKVISSLWDFSGSGPHRQFVVDEPAEGAWRVLMTRHVDAFAITDDPFRRYVRNPQDLIALDRGITDVGGNVHLDPAHPAIVFRYPSRSDDTRTLIATALPDSGYLFSKGYVHGLSVDPATPIDDILALVGYLNSFCADWWVRRFVDRHITKPVLDNLPLPVWDGETRTHVSGRVSELLRRDGTTVIAGGRNPPHDHALAGTSREKLLAEIERDAVAGLGLAASDLDGFLHDFSSDACPSTLREAMREQLA